MIGPLTSQVPSAPGAPRCRRTPEAPQFYIGNWLTSPCKLPRLSCFMGLLPNLNQGRRLQPNLGRDFVFSGFRASRKHSMPAFNPGAHLRSATIRLNGQMGAAPGGGPTWMVAKAKLVCKGGGFSGPLRRHQANIGPIQCLAMLSKPNGKKQEGSHSTPATC